ncbi:ASCH domain-containing protein [Herbaspirillum seropedicae]|uniref:ASCH domain-containing protein n=1 Tax=Herbaspirillum seropedicae TaxID=964 RepID=UPI00111E4597|nr:ASCH domain-containing protein [Herbaspirillum seropedicae]QDD62696.1 ASCH domain-containing protein [Herbaspirillum seropedicae]
MSHLPKSSLLPVGRIVLLSIKPKYADLIVSGAKRVELRRSWAAQEVSKIVIYSSSPVQKLVGIVDVEEAKAASITALWKICTERGGGLTRQELRDYFVGKQRGTGVLLGKVRTFSKHIDPTEIIEGFVPPQSFRYIDVVDYKKLEMKLMVEGKEQ